MSNAASPVDYGMNTSELCTNRLTGKDPPASSQFNVGNLFMIHAGKAAQPRNTPRNGPLVISALVLTRSQQRLRRADGQSPP